MRLVILLWTLTSIISLSTSAKVNSKMLSIDTFGNPILILPGFGNDRIDYISIPESKKLGFSSVLKSRGLDNTYVLPIQRYEWLNIAKGVISPDFWMCISKPQDLFSFYLETLDTTVRAIKKKTGKRTLLLGHSAGGEQEEFFTS
jgi:hypothetical protein